MSNHENLRLKCPGKVWLSLLTFSSVPYSARGERDCRPGHALGPSQPRTGWWGWAQAASQLSCSTNTHEHFPTPPTAWSIRTKPSSPHLPRSPLNYNMCDVQHAYPLCHEIRGSPLSGVLSQNSVCRSIRGSDKAVRLKDKLCTPSKEEGAFLSPGDEEGSCLLSSRLSLALLRSESQ